MRGKHWILGSLIAIAAIIIGCEATKKAVSEVNAFPISDDIKLGKQLSEKIASDPKQFPILPKAEIRLMMIKHLTLLLLPEDISTSTLD